MERPYEKPRECSYTDLTIQEQAEKIEKLESRLADTLEMLDDRSHAYLLSKWANSQQVVMPFSGHDAEHLRSTLKSITDSGLPVEIFGAFLSEYTKTKDLDKARFFAMCEWDC